MPRKSFVTQKDKSRQFLQYLSLSLHPSRVTRVGVTTHEAKQCSILALCVLWSHSKARERINCCCINVTNFARRISAVRFNSITPSRSLFSTPAYDKTDVIVPFAPPACFSNLWFFSLLDSVIFKCCVKKAPLSIWPTYLIINKYKSDNLPSYVHIRLCLVLLDCKFLK